MAIPYGGEFALTDGVREGRIEYQIPINAENTRLSFLYKRGRSRVVQRPFDVLGIRSTEENWEFGISHPLWETPNDQFRLSLSLGIERSRTFISDNDPFSFSDGPQQGRSNLTVLRFTQEWSSRSPAEVVAARSQLSLGLDAFNATRNDDDPDGRFFSPGWDNSNGCDRSPLIPSWLHESPVNCPPILSFPFPSLVWVAPIPFAAIYKINGLAIVGLSPP